MRDTFLSLRFLNSSHVLIVFRNLSHVLIVFRYLPYRMHSIRLSAEVFENISCFFHIDKTCHGKMSVEYILHDGFVDVIQS